MNDKAPHVHMVAICGMGMGPLAVMLDEAGYRVTGSDKAAFPPMSEALAEAGLEILIGFDVSHLEPRPDLAVIGNAVTRENAEAVEVERLGIERISFPEAVSRFFLADKRPLVVAGTHGKTTTTGMLARCLQVAGLDPGYLVGGRVRDLGRLSRAAAGDFFVIEGDEYDSAYFDKGPKFLHYRPEAAIVTSVEFDHADIYRDLDHVKSAFVRLSELLPAGAPLVGCTDYADLLDAVAGVGRGRFIGYGSGENARWRVANVRPGPPGTLFDVVYEGNTEETLGLEIPGQMNALNALAVYVLCREFSVDLAAVREALAGYQGAARRQEIIGEAGGVLVIDDFAHHPTAVAATIAAIRGRYPGRPLRAVFEPRSNTTRRAIFQEHYARALGTADVAVLSAVYAKENDPLRPEEMLSTDRLVEELENGGVEAWSADGPDAILERLTAEAAAGEVVVCMSNGAFGNLPRRLLAALHTRG